MSDLDLMELCRLCLVKNGGNVPIFTDDDPQRIVKITACLPVQISRNDCLPKAICKDCSQKLELSYQFWSTALDAERKLAVLSKQIKSPEMMPVFQIKTESLDIKEVTYEQRSEIYPGDAPPEPRLNFETKFNICEIEQNLTSSSFQSELCSNRRTTIKTETAIKDVDNSDTNKNWSVPRNEDVSEGDNLAGNLHWEGDSTKLITCTLCEYKCSQLRNLKRHMRKHTGEKPYKCSICGCEYSEFGNMKVHMRIHTGEKPYACNVCEYRSSQLSSLNSHMRKHSDEKSYECSLCDYKCKHFRSLKYHMSMHTGDKPYKCTACEYETSQLCTLKVHIRKHTGEKPFMCIICEQRYITSSNLKSHMRVHACEKPYKCNVCGYKCSHQSSLNVHRCKPKNVKLEAL